MPADCRGLNQPEGDVGGAVVIMPPPQVLDVGRAAPQPTYVYDLAALRRQVANLETIPWSSKRMFFASMANDHVAVLRQIRDCGHGIFVNSSKHLRMGLDVGFAPANIVYAASNMTREEMVLC